VSPDANCVEIVSVAGPLPDVGDTTSHGVVEDAVQVTVPAPLWKSRTVWAEVCEVKAAPVDTAAKTSDVLSSAIGGGAALTVSVAALVVAVPTLFVNTALNRLPLSEAAVVVVNEYVVALAPATSVNEAPPFVLTCHCTVGAGDPLAAAENDAVAPAVTD
jgi:hypothetical protein